MNPVSRTLTLIALTCGAAVAQAGNGLGLDAGVGILSFDDVRLSGGNVSGNLLVGDNATLSSMSIQGRGGNSLLVGGNLAFGGGYVGGGNLVVGGGLDAVGGLNFDYGNTTTVWGSIAVPDWNRARVTSGSGLFAPGFDFAAEKSRLTALSTTLDQQAASGTAQLEWGTLKFDTRGQSLAVFDIDAADLGKNMEIIGDANVVINVHGSDVNFGHKTFREGQVLFNVVDATSVTVNSLTATLLAPRATVLASNGQILGQVIANSFEGSSLGITSVAFNGTLPIAAAVPEPGTGLMLLAGLCAMGLLASRRAGNPTLRLAPALHIK